MPTGIVSGAHCQARHALGLARLDAGSGAAKMKIYAGGLGGTLLATFTLNDPAFTTPTTPTPPAPSEASLAGTLPRVATPVATGTPNAFELTTSADVVEFSATGAGIFGTVAGATLVVMNTLSIVSGEDIELTEINSFDPSIITIPN